MRLTLAIWMVAATFVSSASAQRRWWERPQPPPGEQDAPEESPSPEGEDDTPPSRADPEPDVDPSELSPDGTGLIERPTYVWRWQQILASPRIGARLTSLAIDPQNPNRIYVGTEAYTILRSVDGGITWRELELSPFNFVARRLRERSLALPRLGEVLPNGFSIFVDPPYRASPANRIESQGNIGFETFFNFRSRGSVGGVRFQPLNPAAGDIDGGNFGRSIGQTRPPGLESNEGASREEGSIGYIRPLVTVSSPRAPAQLLDDAVREKPISEVIRIAVCPGATFPLMVATLNEILGSMDDGLTWVRLLRLPGRVTMRHIVCDPSNPDLVVAMSSFGAFLSYDGGASFDQDMSGWPGRGGRGAAFDPRPGRSGFVHLAVGTGVFSGDPRSDSGLSWVYPDFNNSSTAPWTTVNWVETAGAEVWVGTNDGLRLSEDGGQNWESVSRLLLSRQRIEQVTVGVNEIATRRVGVIVRECYINSRRRPVCRRSLVYGSDDNGDTWFPFFEGMTRRTIKMIAAAPAVEDVPPRWWIVTGGELWATVPPVDRSSIAEEARAWARARLDSNPTLANTIDATLEHLELTEEDVASFIRTFRNRNLVPEIHFRIEGQRLSGDRQFERSIFLPQRIIRDRDEPKITAYMFAQWYLYNLPWVNRWDLELPATRNRLYSLRRQLSFVVEDAWHERRLHLQSIVAGMSDRLQIEILKERIICLEALLEQWLGQPLETPLRRR